MGFIIFTFVGMLGFIVFGKVAESLLLKCKNLDVDCFEMKYGKKGFTVKFK